MMETRELVCIGCPLGCPLVVELDGGRITVTGNTCPRGESYGKKEVTKPTRTVTSTVRVEGGALPRVSVKTAGEVPKEKIFACMEVIRNTAVQAPVAIGDVIIPDCAGTGTAVIATKNVGRGDC